MKKVVFFFAVVCPQFVFSQWYVLDIMPFPSDGYCIDLCMISPVKGFAAFMLPGQSPHYSEIELEMTNNCWNFSQVVFSQQCNAAMVANQWIDNLEFQDDTLGWFVVEGSFECDQGLYRTLDGQNFTKMSGPAYPHSAGFPSAGTGYILDYNTPYASMGGRLLRYRMSSYKSLRQFDSDPVFESICFINDSTGFFSHDHFFERTSDWGETWIMIDSVSGSVPAIHFPSEAVGYIVKQDNKIYRTADGGLTWTSTDTPDGSRLNSIFFVNDSTGYAVGDTGRIIHTTNGGLIWDPEISPVSTNLTRVQFVAGGAGFIFTWGPNYGGMLLKTFRDAPAFCTVSYDSVAKKNLLLWDTAGTPSGGTFDIYRQSHSNGDFSMIGQVPWNQPGLFTDQDSDPDTASDNYYLTTTDAFGDISLQSNVHSSMLLNLSQDSVTGTSLNWTKYSGSFVNSYILFRKAADSSWKIIDTVNGSINTYDISGFQKHHAYYFIQAIRSGSCSQEPGMYTDPISNIVEFKPVGIPSDAAPGLKIYPNPANDRLFIYLPLNLNSIVRIEIFSPDGRMQREITEIGYNHELDISGLKQGLYILKTTCEKEVTTVKFMKD